MALGNNITTTNRQAINNAITAAERPYKVYSVYIEQWGTDAPAPLHVFENALGVTPVWSRTGQGIYRFTLTGFFENSKTFIQFTPLIQSGDWTYNFSVVSNNYIQATTYQGISAEDETFYGWLEIRVYN